VSAMVAAVAVAVAMVAEMVEAAQEFGLGFVFSLSDNPCTRYFGR
jgi:hypothetical protein